MDFLCERLQITVCLQFFFAGHDCYNGVDENSGMGNAHVYNRDTGG